MVSLYMKSSEPLRESIFLLATVSTAKPESWVTLQMFWLRTVWALLPVWCWLPEKETSREDLSWQTWERWQDEQMADWYFSLCFGECKPTGKYQINQSIFKNMQSVHHFVSPWWDFNSRSVSYQVRGRSALSRDICPKETVAYLWWRRTASRQIYHRSPLTLLSPLGVKDEWANRPSLVRQTVYSFKTKSGCRHLLCCFHAA